MLRRILAAHSSRLDERVLLELANVGSADVARFRNRFPIFQLSDDDDHLRTYRDELRSVWMLPLGYARVLDAWTRRHQVDPNAWSIPLWIAGPDSVEPNPTHLGLLLTMAIRDNVNRLAHCPNLDCPNRFFLKTRKNQKVCDRPACTKFVQREHKRKWWNNNGPEWRAKNRTKKQARTKKRSRE